MTEQRPNFPQLEKACPYWARMAQRGDGIVMTYCSARACEEQKGVGQAWDGPEKSRRCIIGYSKFWAVEDPSIIIHNPLEHTQAFHSFEPADLTDDIWHKVVANFQKNCERDPNLLIIDMVGLLYLPNRQQEEIT